MVPGPNLLLLAGADGGTDWKLRPEERIQVVNLAPADQVTVHSVRKRLLFSLLLRDIELYAQICTDCDERYTVENVDQILNISRTYLQRPPQGRNGSGLPPAAS